ncbi:MAG: DUF494 family protein [Candidatus Cloacimonetes bacterium]|nr:DUF494 family protein [Candidatus Cloacimonadota bacterium]
MNDSRIDELMEIIFPDKAVRAKLKKLGMTEREIKKLIENLDQTEKPAAYYRILAEDEKRVIAPEAFGFLIKLLNGKSINEDMFEKIISLSMQLHLFMKKQIDKRMMDDIVNLIIFSGRKEITVKELLDIFFVDESEYYFDEDIN